MAKVNELQYGRAGTSIAGNRRAADTQIRGSVIIGGNVTRSLAEWCSKYTSIRRHRQLETFVFLKIRIENTVMSKIGLIPNRQ